MKKIKFNFRCKRCNGGIVTIAILVLPALVGCSGKSGDYAFKKPEDAIEK